MLVLSINLAQPRVAQITSHATTTTIYAMRHARIQSPEVLLDLDDWSTTMPNWYTLGAVIHITHSTIMAGAPNDIIADFHDTAAHLLVEGGLACVNERGTLIWESSAY